MDENSTLIVNYVFLSLLIVSLIGGLTSLVLDCFWYKPIIEHEFDKVKRKTKSKPQKRQEEHGGIFDNDVYFK